MQKIKWRKGRYRKRPKRNCNHEWELKDFGGVVGGGVAYVYNYHPVCKKCNCMLSIYDKLYRKIMDELKGTIE